MYDLTDADGRGGTPPPVIKDTLPSPLTEKLCWNAMVSNGAVVRMLSKHVSKCGWVLPWACTPSQCPTTVEGGGRGKEGRGRWTIGTHA